MSLACLMGGGGTEPNSVAATRQSIEGVFGSGGGSSTPPWRVYVQTVTFPPRGHLRCFSSTGKLFLLRAGWQ